MQLRPHERFWLAELVRTAENVPDAINVARVLRVVRPSPEDVLRDGLELIRQQADEGVSRDIADKALNLAQRIESEYESDEYR